MQSTEKMEYLINATQIPARNRSFLTVAMGYGEAV